MTDRIPQAPLISERTVFKSFLDSSSAEPVAMGAFFAAFIVLLVFGLSPVGILGLLICLAVGFYHLPALMKKQPQIVMDRTGLTLDGLGLLPWATIAEMDVTETYLRTMKFERIVLHLTGPVESIVTEQTGSLPMRRFLFKVWDRSGPDQLVIRAEVLKDDAGILAGALQGFLDLHKAS